MPRAKLPSKWLIVGAMMTFIGTAFLSIALNSTVWGYGFDISQSISHYVGLEVWSAIFFTVGNIFVDWFMARYLWQLGLAWRMPRLYYWLIVWIGAALIGLSIWPLGLFDIGDTTSIISWMHMFSSRTMFAAMMVVAAMIVASRKAKLGARIANILFFVYGAVCIYGFASDSAWFMRYVMIFETLYLAAFMMAVAFCDNHHEHLSDFSQ